MKLVMILMTAGVLSFGQTPKNKIIGDKIEGNFLGNGKKITVTAVKVKEGQGNPMEDGTPDQYEIRFSDSKLKPIKAGCCEIILINEGDLNKDGTDEFSIYQAPMNGCTYTLTTYSFIKGNWKKIVDTFMIPTACEGLSYDDMQNRIFRENNNIYYYETDANDENWKLIKRKASSKK